MNYFRGKIKADVEKAKAKRKDQWPYSSEERDWHMGRK